MISHTKRKRRTLIAPIQNNRNRQLTFAKRKAGLFKRAWEMAKENECEIAIVAFSEAGRLAEYSSEGDVDRTLLRYSEYARHYETMQNADYEDDSR
jgi:hypothetical protein